MWKTRSKLQRCLEANGSHKPPRGALYYFAADTEAIKSFKNTVVTYTAKKTNVIVTGPLGPEETTGRVFTQEKRLL